MLQDSKLMAAVSRVVQRSERQQDTNKLLGTYVDVGLLAQLDNSNHQIFYGRRGTGKTHVLKVIESKLAEKTENAVVYVDCRTLGSTSQFSDYDLPIQRRCLALFRDILLAVHYGLLTHIIEHPSSRANDALSEADKLASVITDPVNATRPQIITEERTQARTAGMSGSIGVSPSVADVKGELGAEVARSRSEGTTTQYAVESQDKVIFPELQRALSVVLSLAECRLFLLIDEWSSLPTDIQPHLAEFLKRSLLPLATATLKISALEYRSRFSERNERGITGFEVGADIATAPDLDDYFVYDRNPEQVTGISADVLLRHMNSQLEADYLAKTHGVRDSRQFASRLFTERATFSELVRASEGVMRDLINIFTSAYFNAQRRERDSIDKKAILESARQWFEQDKANQLDEQLQDVLQRIVTEVIGNRRARSFLLPRNLERDPIIQRLFDARVLHHMQRGYADKDNPGIRYNIYAIDYGAYVDLIGTSKEPELDLAPNQEGPDVVVPFDDKRSIRRIVLDKAVLDSTAKY